MGEKILVVEDNELNLKLFCDLLRAHGYQAEPVRDGREAVDRARAFAPDLIVMDIQMPYISGLELIDQLKADAELKATPIMAVTAYAAKGDEERIRDAGAEGYVSKPISVIRFVEAVKTLLAEPRAPAPAEPAETPEPDEPEVRVERDFEASAERLFDAWLDRESVGGWLFATPEGEMARVEIDPMTGGRFEIVEIRGGEDVLHTGIYEEIDRPSRLVFTLQVPKYSEEESRIELSIEPTEEGSRLTLLQQPRPDDSADAAKFRKGWSQVLEQLAEQLSPEA